MEYELNSVYLCSLRQKIRNKRARKQFLYEWNARMDEYNEWKELREMVELAEQLKSKREKLTAKK